MSSSTCRHEGKIEQSEHAPLISQLDLSTILIRGDSPYNGSGHYSVCTQAVRRTDTSLLSFFLPVI